MSEPPPVWHLHGTGYQDMPAILRKCGWGQKPPLLHLTLISKERRKPLYRYSRKNKLYLYRGAESKWRLRVKKERVATSCSAIMTKRVIGHGVSQDVFPGKGTPVSYRFTICSRSYLYGCCNVHSQKLCPKIVYTLGHVCAGLVQPQTFPLVTWNPV